MSAPYPYYAELGCPVRNTENLQDRDDMNNVYEAEKEHQLKDTHEGKAHWKQELASNSEASVFFFFFFFVV